MTMHKKQMETLRFIATDQRLAGVGPDVALLYLRLAYWTEDFGARHPDAGGEFWPTDLMLARLCGVTIEEYRGAVASLTTAGLYEDLGDGVGFDLILPA